MKNKNKSSAAAQLLTLGVVDEEVAVSLIQQAYIQAARAANAGDSKEYRSAMNLIMSLTRLDQDERHKIMDKMLPDQQLITLSANGQPVSPEMLWQTMFNGRTAQTVEALPAPNGDEDEIETSPKG